MVTTVDDVKGDDSLKIFQFTQETGKKVTKFDSDFVMNRIVNTDSQVHIGCMHLEAGGVIGHHEAVVPQLFLVLEGEGKVRGKEDRMVKVSKGDAVFWEKGEGHETTSAGGLTAIVVEGDALNPGLYMGERDF